VYVTTFNNAQRHICSNQQCRFEHISNITSINSNCVAAFTRITRLNPWVSQRSLTPYILRETSSFLYRGIFTYKMTYLKNVFAEVQTAIWVHMSELSFVVMISTCWKISVVCWM